MEIKAKANFIRTSPRKVRLVVDLIRGMTANAAANQLKFINKRAAKPVAKLLNSAIANAGHNYEIEQDNLYIKEIRVDEGPSLHRWTPRAQGRATPIKKRSSHIILVLAEIAESGKVQPKKRKIEAPVKFDRKPKEDEGVKVEDKKDTQTRKITNKFRNIILV